MYNKNKPVDKYSIVSLFTNKKLETIVNVFQQNYINGGSQGLGDFLRGTLYLLYIGNLLNINIDIDFFNHPMSQFLSINKSNYNIVYNDIKSQIDYNNGTFIVTFIEELNKCDSSVFYTFTNLQLNINIDCYIKPFIKLIKPYLYPNQIMISNLEIRYKNFNLFPNKYTVIHIRCGDFYMLNNNNMNDRYIENQKLQHSHIIHILKYLKRNIHQLPSPIFLLSDNNNIKTLITKYFKKISIAIKPIIHLGESKNCTSDSIMFTMLDFYTISNAKEIISFSPYRHGSGFSKYAALLNNIPYKEVRLEPFYEQL
jgi:hypothetical protein